MKKPTFPRVKKPSSPIDQPPEWTDEYKPDPKVEARAKRLDKPMSAEAFARQLERETYDQFHAKQAKADKPPPHPGPNGNGGPAKRKPKREATELNIWKALREETELHEGQLFKLDTFSGQTLLIHPIPVPGVDSPKEWEPTDVTDVDVFHLMVWLQANGFNKVSQSRAGHAVDMEAQRNKFSSAKEFIKSLPVWDGVERLGRFWFDICGVNPDDMTMGRDNALKYLSATARCFFISIVARVMRPGCKADFSPVLEGVQGTQKSTLLRVIAFDKDDWFSDCLPRDLANKDARAHLAGKLIVELPEMHQMKGTSVEGLKQFLSTSTDKFRPSYGRLDIKLKRQCVFVGTTNRADYFHDETGNRRFWPIPCGTINLDLAREIMPQLYAEARNAFLKHEHWWLSPEIEALAEVEQDDRLTDDPWRDGVNEAVEHERGEARRKGETFFYVTSVMGLIKVEGKREQWDQGKQRRVALILRKLGGKNIKLPRNFGWPNRGFRFVTDPK